MTEHDPSRRGIRATLLRWRAPLILIPLVIGLGYSGVRGAELLWAEDPPAPAAAAVVTCWDGAQGTADDCTDPSGVPGLRWTFPSFKPGEPSCTKVVYSDAEPNRPLEYVCRVRLEGTTARIRYSERSTLERGIAFFAERYAGVRPTSTGRRTVFRDPAPRPDGTYEVTVVYDEAPFAVTVNAVNERLRDAVLADFVTLRQDRFLRVRPPQVDDSPDDSSDDSSDVADPADPGE